jgi:hypothetical protein
MHGPVYDWTTKYVDSGFLLVRIVRPPVPPCPLAPTSWGSGLSGCLSPWYYVRMSDDFHHRLLPAILCTSQYCDRSRDMICSAVLVPLGPGPV